MPDLRYYRQHIYVLKMVVLPIQLLFSSLLGDMSETGQFLPGATGSTNRNYKSPSSSSSPSDRLEFSTVVTMSGLWQIYNLLTFCQLFANLITIFANFLTTFRQFLTILTTFEPFLSTFKKKIDNFFKNLCHFF
jgi:hypothetical protein